MEPITKKFVIHHYYQVTIDESAIDRLMQDDDDGSEELQQLNARFHRMFQSIVGNEEALQKILDFQVLMRHCVESNDGFCFYEEVFDWKSEEDNEPEEFDSNFDYGARKNMEFIHILRRVASCLHEEDRAWLKDHPDYSLAPLDLALGGSDWSDEDPTKMIGWNFHAIHASKGKQ